MNPCKYCNCEEPLLTPISNYGVPVGYYVKCPDCKASGPRVPTQKVAIESWNGEIKLIKTKKKNANE